MWISNKTLNLWSQPTTPQPSTTKPSHVGDHMFQTWTSGYRMWYVSPSIVVVKWGSWNAVIFSLCVSFTPININFVSSVFYYHYRCPNYHRIAPQFEIKCEVIQLSSCCLCIWYEIPAESSCIQGWPSYLLSLHLEIFVSLVTRDWPFDNSLAWNAVLKMKHQYFYF